MNTRQHPASFSLAGIRKSYHAGAALHATDLSIRTGEYLVLLGPSGSGKTTLLMILAGFVRPTAGNVFRDETAITNVPPEKRGFGVVFQGYALFPHLTVAENVAFPLKVRGAARTEVETLTKRTIDLMRLQAFSDRLPKQLSGGQQQRVALARALVFSPPLLLLDEPMSALDRKLKEDLQAELRDVHRRVGTTFVHITHDQDEAMSLADRVAVMQDGRIVQLGSPKDLYRRPTSRFVAGFLGKSNFVDGTVQSQDGEIVTVGVGGRCSVRALSRATRSVGETVTIAIRPESVTLSTAVPVGVPLRGSVASTLFFGKHIAVQLEVPVIGTMTAHLSSHDNVPDIGTEVGIEWSDEAAIVIDG